MMFKVSAITLFLTSLTSPVSAFAPSQLSGRKTTAIRSSNDEKPNDDLWGKSPDEKDMSTALPFVARPKLLDGSLPGDVGFDPFSFAGNDKESLLYMREAEIKHGRLAMLAAVGWPLAELWDSKIAALFGLPSALTSTGSSPSILNGGLEKIDFEYWVFVVALAGLVELASADKQEEMKAKYIPGDCGFDPLNFFPENKADQFAMQTKEIKHGRIAMMAVLGYVVQEALYRSPVVTETPFFFKPIF